MGVLERVPYLRGLSPQGRLLYLCMAGHEGLWDCGLLACSLGELQDLTGLDWRELERARAELLDAGLLLADSVLALYWLHLEFRGISPQFADLPDCGLKRLAGRFMALLAEKGSLRLEDHLSARAEDRQGVKGHGPGRQGEACGNDWGAILAGLACAANDEAAGKGESGPIYLDWDPERHLFTESVGQVERDRQAEKSTGGQAQRVKATGEDIGGQGERLQGTGKSAPGQMERGPASEGSSIGHEQAGKANEKAASGRRSGVGASAGGMSGKPEGELEHSGARGFSGALARPKAEAELEHLDGSFRAAGGLAGFNEGQLLINIKLDLISDEELKILRKIISSSSGGQLQAPVQLLPDERRGAGPSSSPGQGRQGRPCADSSSSSSAMEGRYPEEGLAEGPQGTANGRPHEGQGSSQGQEGPAFRSGEADQGNGHGAAFQAGQGWEKGRNLAREDWQAAGADRERQETDFLQAGEGWQQVRNLAREDCKAAGSLEDNDEPAWQDMGQVMYFRNCLGGEESISARQVQEWRKLLPGLDVARELRGLRLWLNDNHDDPAKTAPGPGRRRMEKYLSNCLKKALLRPASGKGARTRPARQEMAAKRRMDSVIGDILANMGQGRAK